MSDIFSLDIETSSLDDKNPQFALEAFRVRQGLAQIDSIAISGPDAYSRLINPVSAEVIKDLLKTLKGKIVYAHNALFDISWMMSYVPFTLCEDINWHDTMLLAKWLLNSQDSQYGSGDGETDEDGRMSYALSNLVKIYLPDHPLTPKFLDIKSEVRIAGQDTEYWLERVVMDATLTKELAKVLLKKLPREMHNGYEIEQKCLPYVARADLMGIPIDRKFVNTLEPRIVKAIKAMSKQLGLPKEVISSPSQLSNYLFTQNDLIPLNRGKIKKDGSPGNGSTAAGDLKMLALNHAGTDIGNKLQLILDMKQILTLRSKYIKGFNNSCRYTTEDVIYPSARIYSTYTGRFTYASKTKRKVIWQKSIATHQLPREGPTKKCLKVPDEEWILKCDASQQELRLIGITAGESNIISGYNNNIDLHSSMAAFIANEPYEEFQTNYHAGSKIAKNYRLAGKLLNLSCQYRIGATALKRKFFETYGIILSNNKARSYLKLYLSKYPGVRVYWKEAIELARTNNYAETLAKRRYGITQWSKNSWQSESSAINTPIQGSAADHKELTILLMSQKFPEIKFFLDIHDEACFYVPRDMELIKEVAYSIANLTPKYNEFWDMELPIDLPFDTILCKENFKEGEEIFV